MNEQTRSEQACPVCGQHTLAVDEPPRIDIMGVQAYSDIVGMGDLHQPGSVGIVCLDCDTHWASKEAFDRGEPDPEVSSDAPADADNDSDEDDDSGDAEPG